MSTFNTTKKFKKFYKQNNSINLIFCRLCGLQLLLSFLFFTPRIVQGDDPLILANVPTFLTGLVAIAQDQQYFSNRHLQLKITSHPTGEEAMTALEKGQADLATVAETAFVLHLFDQPDLRVLALIGSWDNDVRILARRDQGITRPGELKGKRIGTQQRLSTHFFLDQFLLKHGLGMQEVTPVFAKAPELAENLKNGVVDAISMRDPFISQAQAGLGERAVLFEDPGLYEKVFLLAVLKKDLPAREAVLTRFIDALIQAESFIRQEPERARELLRRQDTKVADELQRAWPDLRLRVWLDHRFILTLENVADWAMRNQLVTSRPMPNFLNNLYTRPLQQLRPIAINLLD
ncbi:MAG: NrtA/SsuA/CpmA family ABC transporter substrate-binding protein [Magnetococcales bacterium]|nr:NrtA/SsuA/CpmA family ABC transporter substrate-binding protein [Magnetococcales bacterium]